MNITLQDASDEMIVEPVEPDQTELRALALLICQESDAPGSPPRCEEPCPWCLNEARLEAAARIEGQVDE